MKSKVNGLFYVLIGSLVGSLMTIGVAVGAGTANAGCVSATGTATVDCDGMLHSDLSGSSIGAVLGHGGAETNYSGTQGDMCAAGMGAVSRCMTAG